MLVAVEGYGLAMLVEVGFGGVEGLRLYRALGLPSRPTFSKAKERWPRLRASAGRHGRRGGHRTHMLLDALDPSIYALPISRPSRVDAGYDFHERIDQEPMVAGVQRSGRDRSNGRLA